jgi:hypothetical protein
MDPVVETFGTESAARDRVRGFSASDMETVEVEDRRRGMRAICAFPRPGRPGTPTIVEWPEYGRPLKELKVVVRTSAQLEAAFQEHSGHPGFRTFTDVGSMVVGATCHCLAHGGKSLVFEVKVGILSNMTEQQVKDLRAMMERI